MRIPTVEGLIERRMLVNYRVRPEALAGVLPASFRPQLVRGWGVAGVCLIRLAQIRPRGWPRQLGLRSENAAHRIAVQWKDEGQWRRGVYIPRRDTSSQMNALAGGRLFPGLHHHACFETDERDDAYHVALASDDGETRLSVRGRLAQNLPADSLFDSLAEASAFFQAGSLGYSDTQRAGVFDGLELRTFNWSVRPLDVETVESSFFSDRDRFPPGSVEFDHALLMTDIQHEWRGRPLLRASEAARFE